MSAQFILPTCLSQAAPCEVIHSIDFLEIGDKAQWQLQTITQSEMKVKAIAVLALKDCWTFHAREAHVSGSSHVVNRKYSLNIVAESPRSRRLRSGGFVRSFTLVYRLWLLRSTVWRIYDSILTDRRDPTETISAFTNHKFHFRSTSNKSQKKEKSLCSCQKCR